MHLLGNRSRSATPPTARATKSLHVRCARERSSVNGNEISSEVGRKSVHVMGRNFCQNISRPVRQ